MNSNTNLTVDLQRPNIAVIAYGVQGDSLSRQLTLTLIDGDKPWTPPAGALPVVRYGKPDGTCGFYDTLENGQSAVSVSGNIATVTLAEQALTVPGNVAMQLNFFSAAGMRISSFSWVLKVEQAAVEDGKILSSDYGNMLTTAISEAIRLLPQIEAAAGKAEDAEAWAVGQRNGVNVPSGDPTYNNSSKYWAEQAYSATAGGALSYINFNYTGVQESRTLALSDTRCMLGTNSNVNSTITLTIPADSAVNFPQNTEILISRLNGPVVIASASGVTVASEGGRRLISRYGVVALKKIASNFWFLTGDLEETGAGPHNSRCPCRYLGPAVTAAQYTAIADGTFDELYAGDYWTIGGVNWRILGINYLLNSGDVPTTKNHLVVAPDTSLYNAPMNDTNTTAGGYAGSKMRTEGLEQAKTTINAAFPGHVLSHRIYLVNAVTDGHPSAGAWYDSEVDLMNEQMVYGGPIFMPIANGSATYSNFRVEKSQLPLFTLDPSRICNRATFWLRDVVTSTDLALVSSYGSSSCSGASSSLGVRPYFLICGEEVEE